jgi:restriction system protein
MTAAHRFPTAASLMWPILEIMRQGDEAITTDQIERALVLALNLSAGIVQEKHRDTNRTEIGYRAAWARTRLRKLGYIEHVQRATWRLTDRGRTASKEAVGSK